MPRNSRQSITPKHFSTKDLAESHWRELIVKVFNFTVCYRYLMSKLLFTKESFTNTDAVTLFVVFEKVLSKMEVDRQFRDKYAHDTFQYRALFQSLNELVKVPPEERSRLLSMWYGNCKSELFSKRYYYSIEGQRLQLFETFAKQRYPKVFPAKAFVGKGYGDHGTAKNKATDGSPDWKEVAMSHNDDTKESKRRIRTRIVTGKQIGRAHV